ncbi:MAG TPA: glycosyl transferase family 2 [Porphyromonadaceae bacterium]|jgi:glycosyltransferase involved in cell wall biosynthesis|nr:glycosyl transferase family 2 [Porphyromonadaceae bacterium]HBX21099.1 glycosyl transferase family 2 [Porphyromonadaceae bacterium]HCM22066.1 glycosyl transferase family 2 [Porphyromonadaceae bacterium]
MFASVIISTYNSPEWLEKVLIGYAVQSNPDIEIVIADDGSEEATKEVIDRYKSQFRSLKHVWHEDMGFRKCEILNKAILASTTDYLIFTDGDCIPRKDFVQAHIDHRKENCFLSGGYFKLPMSISQLINPEDIIRQNCFSLRWLKDRGLAHSFKNNKLSKNNMWVDLLNRITTTNPTWNGHNASGWKKDIVAVNGFDERMKYGGEDRELGERLENAGIKGLQIRYKAICIHLDHSRGYANEKDWKINNQIRQETKQNRAKRTSFGIVKS